MKKFMIVGVVVAIFLLVTMSCVSAVEFNTVTDVQKSLLRRNINNIDNIDDIKQKLDDFIVSKIINQPSENWFNLIFELIKFILAMAITFSICIPLDIFIILLRQISLFDIIPDFLEIILLFFTKIVNFLDPTYPNI